MSTVSNSQSNPELHARQLQLAQAYPRLTPYIEKPKFQRVGELGSQILVNQEDIAILKGQLDALMDCLDQSFITMRKDMENELVELWDVAGRVNDQQLVINKKISTVENDVAGVKSDQAALKREQLKLYDLIDQVNKNIPDYSSIISKLQSDARGQDGRIKQNETDIGTLDRNIKTLDSKQTDNYKKMQKCLDELTVGSFEDKKAVISTCKHLVAFTISLLAGGTTYGFHSMFNKIGVDFVVKQGAQVTVAVVSNVFSQLKFFEAASNILLNLCKVKDGVFKLIGEKISKELAEAFTEAAKKIFLTIGKTPEEISAQLKAVIGNILPKTQIAFYLGSSPKYLEFMNEFCDIFVDAIDRISKDPSAMNSILEEIKKKIIDKLTRMGVQDPNSVASVFIDMIGTACKNGSVPYSTTVTLPNRDLNLIATSSGGWTKTILAPVLVGIGTFAVVEIIGLAFEPEETEKIKLARARLQAGY